MEAILPATSAASSRGSSRAGVDVVVPTDALTRIAGILQRGSVDMLRHMNAHSGSAQAKPPHVQNTQQQQSTFPSAFQYRLSSKPGSGVVLRRAFAKACFKALVDCSRATHCSPGQSSASATGSSGPGSSDWIGVGAMADECVALLKRHLPHITSVDMSDQSAEEVLFVVSACASLVDKRHQLLAKQLFPVLVDVSACARPDVARAVRSVLHLYHSLF